MNFYFSEPSEIATGDAFEQLRSDQHLKIEKYLEASLFLYGPGELKNLLLQALGKLDVWISLLEDCVKCFHFLPGTPGLRCELSIRFRSRSK
jgi:hypothetical protein